MRLVWVDRAGVVRPAGAPDRPFENVVIAPDGTRAIVQIRGSFTELWMYEFGRNTLTPIGRSAGSNQAPLFSPDGLRVIYRGTRKGTRNLYWRAIDGSGDEERLTTKPDVSQTPTSISRDGRWLLFNENDPADPGGTGSWMLRLDGDHTPQRLFTDSAGESDPQISPDGKWIAFQAAVSSRQEIFVAPFPAAGPRRQVSTDGGGEPLWSRDGHELYFQSGTKLMSVSISPGVSFASSVPRLVHEGRFFRTINGNTSYDITPDGSRFLRIEQVTPARPITQMELVLNWFQELNRSERR
jgi:Tol biopolymer transport system component